MEAHTYKKNKSVSDGQLETSNKQLQNEKFKTPFITG